MNLYEDFYEGPPKNEIDEEEIIPVEAMPNITLPKINIKNNFEPCSVKPVCLESPNSFYLQMQGQQEYFCAFRRNMNQFYVRLKDPPLNTNDLPLASTWAAYSRGGWHRAVVLNKEKDSGFPVFKMKFVDYGYAQLVSLEHIRYLEAIFTYDPPFAVHCKLSQVFPINKWTLEPWTEECFDFFKDFCFLNEELNGIFMNEKSDGKWEVVLESRDGVVINEELVTKKFATSALIDGFSQIADETTEEEVLNNNNDIKVEEPKTNLELKCDWNPMEEEFHQNVSSGYINDASAELVLNGFENNDYKYVCRQMRWYGKCRRGDACPWSHKMPRKDGLPSSKVPLYFRLKEEPDIPPVGSCFPAIVTSIYSPSKFYIQILPYNSNAEKGRDVITLKNPFHDLQTRLLKVYRNSSGCLTSPLPAVGELVIAYTNQLPVQGFYRARVLQVKDGDEVKVEVFFIDVGNTEWITENQLRPFYPQFLNPPAQATMCYLSEVIPREETKWLEKANKLFSEFICNVESLQTVVVMEVDELNEDRIGIVILDPNKEDTINDMIKSI